MENNIENKAKFFAMYLGQQLMYPTVDNNDKYHVEKLTHVAFSELGTTYKRKRDGSHGDYISFKSNGYHNCDGLNAKIVLKSLENLSYDDVGFIVKNFDDIPLDVMKGEIKNPRTVDMLRLKGYLTPWMDLSVNDILKYGWVEIKKI